MSVEEKPVNGISVEETDGKSKSLDADDILYKISVISPGGDKVELQVSSVELVQEIHRVLVDREETCQRTCFSLQYEGQTLDMFSEIKSIPEIKDGAVIKVIEDRYNVREARNHMKHVHDMLTSTDLKDAYMGREQMSLSFVSNITGGDLLEQKPFQPKVEQLNVIPPDYIIPGNVAFAESGPPLLPLHPADREGKPIVCLKQINYSNWNSPPSQRRLAGDLIYLYVHTLEDKRHHITCCPRGFFVNQSTDSEFNFKPQAGINMHHSLIDLLKKISPSFKKNFDLLLKRRSSKHAFERVPTAYQVNPWLSPIFDHNADSVRKEEAFSSRMACEENLPGQTRDWNEELQMSHELPQEKLSERMLRDRSVFKTNSDFVAAATRAAIGVVNGDIMAINPGEMKKQQMYIWNNIFFSFGFDIKDHYKDFGGEAAAYVATSSDLNGVRAYSMLDQLGLHVLGTAIIDYRGYRVTAQTIIPGILEKEQEELVVYGSIDFGKSIVSSKRYEDSLAKTADQLKIRPHNVVNASGETIKLYSSVDCKGIIGNDGRAYILDLLRTFPPDLNYMGGQVEECRPKLSQKLTEAGYPYVHTHLLANLRQELIEAFVDHQYENFLRKAAQEIQKRRSDKPKSSDDATNGDIVKADDKTSQLAKEIMDAKNLVKELQDPDTAQTSTKEAIKVAAKHVGSLNENNFEILFNPDVYHKYVNPAQSENLDIVKDQELILKACEFLVFDRIPQFIQEMVSLSVTPQDGRSLIELMHQRGINVRYLNKLMEGLNELPKLDYVKKITVMEIFMRSAKHIFKTYMQDVDPMLMSASVAHFLNCMFTSCTVSWNALQGIDEHIVKLISHSVPSSKNKKNKKKSNQKTKDASEELSWTTETPFSMWSAIVTEAKSYFHYDLTFNDFDAFCHAHELKRNNILRCACQTFGIQLHLREYQLVPPNGVRHSKPIFHQDDVVALLPLVKHLHPHATDAYQYFTTGQARISAGLLQEGFELINEALGLLNGVYGPLHPDIGTCNRLLARLSYVMGEHQAALLFQQRAAIISERVHGIDSPNAAAEYIHLAVYCFACGHVNIALNLLYRARYICILCHSENHPELAQIDTNIGLMLLLVDEYDLSAVFLESALNLNKLFHEPKSLKEAFSCHLLSRTHVYRGDFRTAVEFEKQRHAIYREKLGPENDYTVDSDECLKVLLKHAVDMAKKAIQLNNGTNGGNTNLRPPSPEVQSHKNKESNVHKSESSHTANLKASLSVMDSLDKDKVSNLSSMSSNGPLAMSGGAASLFQYPSLPAILETLNRVNGIYVIQLTSQDLERVQAAKKLVKKSEAAANSVPDVNVDSKEAEINTNKMDAQPVKA